MRSAVHSQLAARAIESNIPPAAWLQKNPFEYLYKYNVRLFSWRSTFVFTPMDVYIYRHRLTTNFLNRLVLSPTIMAMWLAGTAIARVSIVGHKATCVLYVLERFRHAVLHSYSPHAPVERSCEPKETLVAGQEKISGWWWVGIRSISFDTVELTVNVPYITLVVSKTPYWVPNRWIFTADLKAVVSVFSYTYFFSQVDGDYGMWIYGECCVSCLSQHQLLQREEPYDSEQGEV